MHAHRAEGLIELCNQTDKWAEISAAEWLNLNLVSSLPLSNDWRKEGIKDLDIISDGSNYSLDCSLLSS